MIQSIVSLDSSLVVKMLSVLVSTISNSQVLLLKKMWVAFAFAKATHIFFSKNISVHAIFHDQSLNKMLTTTSLVLNNWAEVVKRLLQTIGQNMVRN